jgi:phosphoenolpyruvate carboxykinase (ATP)
LILLHFIDLSLLRFKICPYGRAQFLTASLKEGKLPWRSSEFTTRQRAGDDRFGRRIRVRYNFSAAVELYEEAIRRGEAELTAHGRAARRHRPAHRPLAQGQVRRSRRQYRRQIWWDNNKPMSPEHFALLKQDMLAHAAGKDAVRPGSDRRRRRGQCLPTRVVTEFAWHSLFIRNLLIRPERRSARNFVPKLTIIDLPSFKADPARHGCRTETVIACDFTRQDRPDRRHLLCRRDEEVGLHRAQLLLPAKGVMPMHCSANVGPDGDAAFFFGLSGTGKTTLSADPKRTLIGDDEHGWGEERHLQFRRRLLRQDHQAVGRSRAGNLCDDAALRHGARKRRARRNREPDFNDGSLTENTRCAYPLDFIPNASRTGRPASEERSSC